MKSLTNIYRLGIKELRSLRHDVVLLFFIVWAFSGAIYTVASGTSQELHNAPIAIVDEDRSQLSNRIVDAFYPPYFSVPAMISVADIDPGMDSGRYSFVVDIPPDFERDTLAGRRPEIQVNIDATMMTQSFIGSSYIQNIIAGEVNEFLQGTRESAALPVELATRVKFNPNLTSTWFGSVMELVNMITMLSVILTGAALIREREHGTIEHLLVMPLKPHEIVLAKVWSNGLVVLVAAGLSLWLVVQGLLKVPIAGSIPLFMFGAALFLFSTTALGIFMGTVARSMPQLGLLMILVILPLQLLSGGVTPRESMPEFLQDTMLLAPTTHFVGLSQAVLYRGAGFEIVWKQFVAILVIGIVLIAASLVLFRKSVGVIQN